VKKEIAKLYRNPPKAELPRVANAIDFSTEFPIAKRFGGKKNARNIVFIVGSGRRDPKETYADYVRVAHKAHRLGIIIFYIGIHARDETTGGGRVDRDVHEDAAERALKESHVVSKVIDFDLDSDKLSVGKVWKQTSPFIFPTN
jgi:hypothetical protein